MAERPLLQVEMGARDFVVVRTSLLNTCVGGERWVVGGAGGEELSFILVLRDMEHLMTAASSHAAVKANVSSSITGHKAHATPRPPTPFSSFLSTHATPAVSFQGGILVRSFYPLQASIICWVSIVSAFPLRWSFLTASVFTQTRGRLSTPF